MGGGGNDVEKPKAPEPPKASSSIEDYIENQPKLFELQQEQAPQEAQLQLDLLQDFGPQFGQTAKFMQEQLNPETSAIQEELAATARSRSKGGLSDLERDQFTSDFSGQLGTNAGSPIGALASSRALMLANQGRQREGENLGLSLAGRQQLAQGQAPNVNNISGSLTPGQVLGFDQGNFGTQANIFGSQAGMFNNQQTNAQSGRNALTSGLFSMGSSALGSMLMPG